MTRPAKTFRKRGSTAVRQYAEEGEALFELAHEFAKDGLVDFERPPQPRAPETEESPTKADQGNDIHEIS